MDASSNSDMTNEPPSIIESIIAADVGSTMTKAVLIDTVEGEYRLIARADFPSTFEPPWSDVSLALQQCLARLEEIASRKLLDPRGRPILPEQNDGSGVDAFVATVSAAEPLHVMVMGLMRDYSVESARKATLTTYAYAQDDGLVAIDTKTQEGARWDLPARIAALHKHTPSVIVLTGGNEKGAVAPLLDVLTAVQTACVDWPGQNKPDVIFAGNSAARPQVAEKLGELTVLHVVDNVRPTAQAENLQPLEAELEKIYVEKRLNMLSGFATITSAASKAVMPTATAFALGVNALARHFDCKLGAIGVDIGGATTSMVWSNTETLQRVIRSDLGMSYNIEAIARQAGIANVLRWLPIEMSEAEAWDRLANKALRPFTLPESKPDLLLEQAVAREAIHLVLQDLALRWPAAKKAEGLPRLDMIIGAGGVLTHAPYPRQTALLLLDAFQPASLVYLALDSGGLMPQLGLIASVQPEAAAQLTAREGLTVLGAAIGTTGAAKPGEVVVRYKMTDEKTSQVLATGEVHAGEIEVLPLPQGQRANLELKPSRNIDVGSGRGREPKSTVVEGGAAGVIIDARGRPLILPEDAEKRRAQNQEWLYNIGT